MTKNNTRSLVSKRHTLALILAVIVLLSSAVLQAQTAQVTKQAIKSQQAVNAITAYEAAEKKAKADYDKAVATARTAAIKQLEAAMAAATKAGNLDEAVAIREKIAALKAEEEVGTPKPFVAAIVGTWKESGNTSWVFTEDGKFSVTGKGAYGTWTITATELRLVFTSANHSGRVDTFQSRDGDTIKGKSSWGHAVALKKDADK